jgi:hypothetical protein
VNVHGRRRGCLFRVLAVCLAVTAALIVGEIAVRIRRRSRPRPNNVFDAFDFNRSEIPTDYDPLLGYVPRPSTRCSIYSTTVTIDERGLRANGTAPVASGASVLALGDSFAFGSEVDDDATWPSHLERISGRRVFNAGVYGYGFDQVVLRAEHLAPVLPAEDMVVGIIPEDILRCGYSYKFAWKPFFDVGERGELVLKGVPPPRPEVRPPLAPVSPLKRALGASQLADAILSRFNLWNYPYQIPPAHGRDVEVSCLLVDRLAAVARDHRKRLLLVTEVSPPYNLDKLPRVVASARAAGVEVLDLASELEARSRADPDATSRFFVNRVGHMSSEGNRWVAERIADTLRQR